jgi:hypothetical protein
VKCSLPDLLPALPSASHRTALGRGGWQLTPCSRLRPGRSRCLDPRPAIPNAASRSAGDLADAGAGNVLYLRRRRWQHRLLLLFLVLLFLARPPLERLERLERRAKESADRTDLLLQPALLGGGPGATCGPLCASRRSGRTHVAPAPSCLGRRPLASVERRS